MTGPGSYLTNAFTRLGFKPSLHVHFSFHYLFEKENKSLHEQIGTKCSDSVVD